MLLALLLLTIVPPGSPELRAIAFLEAEVPRWSKENRCFSCHNDGDGARALYQAARLGEKIRPEALEATGKWLGRPDSWGKNGGDGPFSDKRLARLQFTIALASAVEAGKLDRSALRSAAETLARDQAADGSWPIDEPGPVGSPATYGIPLATYLGREALRTADPAAFRESIAKADAFLGKIQPENVDEAAVVLLTIDGSRGSEATGRRREALAILRKAESPDGGWGPFLRSPAETFDTSLALIALNRARSEPGVPGMIARGRAALIASQEPDGGWTETTRPSGGESYAQRISTSAWATIALLSTRP